MSEFHHFIATFAGCVMLAFAAGWKCAGIYRRHRAARKARRMLAAVELQWHGYGYPPIKIKPRWCRGTKLKGKDFRP